VLSDAGVPKWRPGWSRRGEADVRTVAEAVIEMVAGGKGSKKRRKRKGLQRGERNRRWLLVVGWWLCWLPVVDMVVEKLVVAVTTERRERVKQTAAKEIFWGGGLVFSRLWTQFSPPSSHEIHLYL